MRPPSSILARTPTPVVALALLTSLTACPFRPPPTDARPPTDAHADGPSDAHAATTDASLDASLDAPLDVPVDHAHPDVPPGSTFCSLGDDVPGAVLPPGFCIRRYASVTAPRVLLVMPSGELFVSQPNNSAPGGAGDGPGGIGVLADDDHDGLADTADDGTIPLFLSGVPSIHGLTLGGGYLYFTSQSTVYRTPYAPGQRAETAGAREDLTLPVNFSMGGRWTHGLAYSTAGTLFATRGQYGMCGTFAGGEISRASTGTLAPVATGLRNPMYMRCHFRDATCAASELGEDQTPGYREKIVFVRDGTDYGYPCCWTANLPATNADCTRVAQEDGSFPLGDTPFGLDWERGAWDAPWQGALFVALHGSYYSTPPWQGARVVFAPTDPAAHTPSGAFQDFLTGFGPGGSPLERPADVVFAPDGRMFLADDLGNAVYWIAPTDLRIPGR